MNRAHFLYRTVPGRLCLKLITRPGLSRAAGAFLDSRASRALIAPFQTKTGIDMTEYEQTEYPSFNAFFCRRIRPQMRPVDLDPSHLVSPCDGLLKVLPITRGTVLPVKQSAYSVPGLLRDPQLAAQFEGGLCLVFRLCVNHYHRYCFPDWGSAESPVHIDGVLHTVRPVALENLPVFTENTREYTLLHTENFGDIVQMEVGATLVGRIANRPGVKQFGRGEEKGCFLYGGSTVILLVKKGVIDPMVGDDTCETPVRQGQCIAIRRADV